jgi:hypothetical protein
MHQGLRRWRNEFGTYNVRNSPYQTDFCISWAPGVFLERTFKNPFSKFHEATESELQGSGKAISKKKSTRSLKVIF